MCKNFLKTLNDVKDEMGEEAVFKLLEGMSAIELFKRISKDKHVKEKNNDLSEKRRAAANARWNAQRNTNTVCKTDMQNSDASVDTQQVMQNAYANLDANSECKMECKVDAKEEYVEPTSVHTEQDLINVAESVSTKPVVQTTNTASYSELQAQLSKFEEVAEEVMNTNDPFTIKAFRSKLDAWYKGAGAGAVEFIGDVNFITQQLVAKLAEITEKEKNNEQH